MSVPRYEVLFETLGRWPQGRRITESDLPEGSDIERLIGIKAIAPVPDDAPETVQPDILPSPLVIPPPPDHAEFNAKLQSEANKPPVWLSKEEHEAKLAQAEADLETDDEPEADMDAELAVIHAELDADEAELTDDELDELTKPEPVVVKPRKRK